MLLLLPITFTELFYDLKVESTSLNQLAYKSQLRRRWYLPVYSRDTDVEPCVWIAYGVKLLNKLLLQPM